MSVQYRSATSATGASSGVNLSGSIPAGGYYLVGGNAVAGGTSIPTPDGNNNAMNLSGTAGVVILANTTAANLLTNAQIGAGPSIVGTPGSNALIQDLVGYGLTPDRYETNRAPAPSTTTVIKRTAPDNDDNSTEFTASATGDPTASAPSPLAATNPGNKTGTVGQAITALQPQRHRRHPALHLDRPGPPAPGRHRRTRRHGLRHADHGGTYNVTV